MRRAVPIPRRCSIWVRIVSGLPHRLPYNRWNGRGGGGVAGPDATNVRRKVNADGLREAEPLTLPMAGVIFVPEPTAHTIAQWCLPPLPLSLFPLP